MKIYQLGRGKRLLIFLAAEMSLKDFAQSGRRCTVKTLRVSQGNVEITCHFKHKKIPSWNIKREKATLVFCKTFKTFLGICSCMLQGASEVARSRIFFFLFFFYPSEFLSSVFMVTEKLSAGWCNASLRRTC